MTLQTHTFMYVIYILISFVQYTRACVYMYTTKPLVESNLVFSL